MAKLFNVIDNKFFSVLSAPNRELYLDCILEINQRVDELEREQGNTKKRITDCIEQFLSDRADETISEDDAIELTGNREKANYLVNKIKDCGWIYEEDLGGSLVLINFYPNAAKMIRLIKEISSGANPEYTGYFSTILHMAEDIADFKEVTHVEQMHKHTDELVSRLKSLKSTIFTYYNTIVESTEFVNANQILDELMERYKRNFFDKAYYNLKTFDELSKYKDRIQRKIREVCADNHILDKLITSRVNDVYKTNEEAEDFVREKLDFVYESFDNMDALIKSIDDKNQKYIQAAISKAMFFINRSNDFEGIFNRLAELINDDKLIYGDYYVFNLFDTKQLDTDSLHEQRDYVRTKVSVESIMDAQFDDALQEEKMNELLKNKEFSYAAIVDHVGKLLDGKICVLASEIPQNDVNEFVKLILIYLYSKSPGCKYKTISKNEKVSINGVTFLDFSIERGGK